jgi:hypothetical protein
VGRPGFFSPPTREASPLARFVRVRVPSAAARVPEPVARRRANLALAAARGRPSPAPLLLAPTAMRRPAITTKLESSARIVREILA